MAVKVKKNNNFDLGKTVNSMFGGIGQGIQKGYHAATNNPVSTFLTHNPVTWTGSALWNGYHNVTDFAQHPIKSMGDGANKGITGTIHNVGKWVREGIKEAGSIIHEISKNPTVKKMVKSTEKTVDSAMSKFTKDDPNKKSTIEKMQKSAKAEKTDSKQAPAKSEKSDKKLPKIDISKENPHLYRNIQNEGKTKQAQMGE